MAANPATICLRWVLSAILLLHLTVTLIGQPEGFWGDPRVSIAYDPVVGWLVRRGYALTIVAWLAFIAGSFALVTFLPKKLGPIVLYALVLVSFATSAGFLADRLDLGMIGAYFYSVVIATALVSFAGQKEPNQPPEPTR